MKRERVFLGVVLIFASIALIIKKLGYFGHINIFSIVLTIFLIGIMIKSIFKRNFAGILFPIAFICIIFDDKLGITSITPWTVLIAAALGSFGLSMIFPNKSRKYYHNHNWSDKNSSIIYEDNKNSIKLNTSFSHSTKNINNLDFERVDINCSFGRMEVYFDNTVLKDGRGIIMVDTSFSNVELYIPKSWTVENKTNSSFGGLNINEKNISVGTSENILTIIGNISFAVVDIIYV